MKIKQNKAYKIGQYKYTMDLNDWKEKFQILKEKKKRYINGVGTDQGGENNTEKERYSKI